MAKAEPAVRVFRNGNEVTRMALAAVLAAAEDAVRERGTFHLVLAGGSTPRGLYVALASEALAGRADLGPWHLFWGDERFVPPDHPDSNYRMAREALLDPARLPAERVHPIETASGSPEEAAAAYERELRAVPGLVVSDRPRFDLVLLGMGPDGHTASLFPGTAALGETSRWCVANRVDALGAWRVTLTFPSLNAARSVLFLVTGSDKAGAAVAAIHGTDGEPPPAGRVRPTEGTLAWFLDRDAAAGLDLAPQGSP